MANRYTYQFNGSLKPKMNQIEGFVSIGTGGTVNSPLAYPIFPVATGATGLAVQTGPPLFPLPGQATAAVPTGWQGGFSGCVGLIGAGVQGVQRVGTGLMAIGLSDDWVSLDSLQVNIQTSPSGTPTGPIQPGFSGCYQADLGWCIAQHTVGLGNSVVTGGYTGFFNPGPNPKNMIWLQFTQGGQNADLPAGGGFYIDIRVRDSLAGVH
jgi:hypothetical protein